MFRSFITIVESEGRPSNAISSIALAALRTHYCLRCMFACVCVLFVSTICCSLADLHPPKMMPCCFVCLLYLGSLSPPFGMLIKCKHQSICHAFYGGCGNVRVCVCVCVCFTICIFIEKTTQKRKSFPHFRCRFDVLQLQLATKACVVVLRASKSPIMTLRSNMCHSSVIVSGFVFSKTSKRLL